MIIQYKVKEDGKTIIGDILYCCEVMRQAIKNNWVEIPDYNNPPQLYFETDGTWEGISKYCYNCGREVKLKEVKAK